MLRRLRLVFFLAATALVAHAGNTTCADPTATWYLNKDGETPCRQYERLRQLCDPRYEVGDFRPLTPGDNCDSQLKDCCCNSVAFALSMICMNCQQGLGTGREGDNGIDAGVGAYQLYLAGCRPTNQSLPETVQNRVCESGLSLGNYLYGLFWGDGAWFYEYTRQVATLHSSDPNERCPNLNVSPSSSSSTLSASAPASSSTLTSAPQPSQSAPAASANVGAIAGGIIAGVVVLIIIAAFLWYRRRKNRGTQAIDLAAGEGDISEVRHQPGLAATPFIIPPAGSQGQGNGSQTHLHATIAKGSAASRSDYGGAGNQAYAASGTAPSSSGAPSSEASHGQYPQQSHGEAAHQGYPTTAGSRKTLEDARGAYSTVSPSTGYNGSSGVDDDRHVDAGISLGRSMSGRLPPAYPGAGAGL